MGVPGAQVIHHGIFCDPSPHLSIGRIELRRRLGWPETKSIMLFVAAQIDDQLKGWTILERAIHRLRKPGRWHLMIVGNDRKGVVRTSSYPVRTTLLGPLTRLEVMECFHAADLYVNPTLGETFGLTTLEALGEGTDVLCSNLAVLQEIAGSAATVFPTGSSDVLAARLDDYQPVIPEARFSRAARIRERFLTQRMAERYRTLYQTVLLGRRSHGS